MSRQQGKFLLSPGKGLGLLIYNNCLARIFQSFNRRFNLRNNALDALRFPFIRRTWLSSRLVICAPLLDALI